MQVPLGKEQPPHKGLHSMFSRCVCFLRSLGFAGLFFAISSAVQQTVRWVGMGREREQSTAKNRCPVGEVEGNESFGFFFFDQISTFNWAIGIQGVSWKTGQCRDEARTDGKLAAWKHHKLVKQCWLQFFSFVASTSNYMPWLHFVSPYQIAFHTFVGTRSLHIHGNGLRSRNRPDGFIWEFSASWNHPSSPQQSVCLLNFSASFKKIVNSIRRRDNSFDFPLLITLNYFVESFCMCVCNTQ